MDDLRAVCGEGEARAKLMTADGVHFTPEGQTKLGKAVAEFLAKQLPAKP